MLNPDNKTNLLSEIKLTNYVNLIETNPCHIATVNKDNTPNLSVASDIKVLDDVTILISNNEMIHTPDNIIANNNGDLPVAIIIHFSLGPVAIIIYLIFRSNGTRAWMGAMLRMLRTNLMQS